MTETSAKHLDYSVWGVSFRTAPLAVRELWALDAEQKERVLRALHEDLGGQLAVLATCNRTEFYFLRPEPPSLDAIGTVLGALKERRQELDPAIFYFHAGAEAVSHLFSVAAGLDSQILGETEIQGQVKSDLTLARTAGTCGHELGRLFDHALRAGKRVRTETRLSEGVLSAGQAGVLLAGKVLGSLSGAQVLLIGTGKIGKLTARTLLDQGVGELRVASRTEANARRARPFVAPAPPSTHQPWLSMKMRPSSLTCEPTGAPVASKARVYHSPSQASVSTTASISS